MGLRYAVLRIDDVEPRRDFAGLRFRPLRPLLGIEAFGVAGWVADAGEEVIVDHTEPEDGQEELYVVLAGRARFALGDDEEVAAGVGTCVAVPAGVRRRATAEVDGTSVLAVGAPRGAAYSAPGGEHSAVAAAEYRRGDFPAAVTLLRDALAEHPAVLGVVYNLACCEALSGAARGGARAPAPGGGARSQDRVARPLGHRPRVDQGRPQVRRRRGLARLDRERDLHERVPAGDLAVLDVAGDRHDLDVGDAADGAAGRRHRLTHGRVGAVGGASDHLDDLRDRHAGQERGAEGFGSSCGSVRGTGRGRRTAAAARR